MGKTCLGILMQLLSCVSNCEVLHFYGKANRLDWQHIIDNYP